MAIINNLTDVWNSSGTVFTAIKMAVTNTASAAGSKLIDLISGGISRFSVDSSGNAVHSGTVTASNLSGSNTGDQTNIAGNAATVTTNANLTGPVTSTGNATAIANGAISNAMLANGAVANLSGANTGDSAVNSLYSGLAASKADIAGAAFTGAISAPGFVMDSGGIITEATAARTLTAGDNGKDIYFLTPVGPNCTLTMPAGLPIGFSVVGYQGTNRAVTFAVTGGAQMIVAGGFTQTAYRGAPFTIFSPTADFFIISGTLA